MLNIASGLAPHFSGVPYATIPGGNMYTGSSEQQLSGVNFVPHPHQSSPTQHPEGSQGGGGGGTGATGGSHFHSLQPSQHMGQDGSFVPAEPPNVPRSSGELPPMHTRNGVMFEEASMAHVMQHLRSLSPSAIAAAQAAGMLPPNFPAGVLGPGGELYDPTLLMAGADGAHWSQAEDDPTEEQTRMSPEPEYEESTSPFGSRARAEDATKETEEPAVPELDGDAASLDTGTKASGARPTVPKMPQASHGTGARRPLGGGPAAPQQNGGTTTPPTHHGKGEHGSGVMDDGTSKGAQDESNDMEVEGGITRPDMAGSGFATQESMKPSPLPSVFTAFNGVASTASPAPELQGEKTGASMKQKERHRNSPDGGSDGGDEAGASREVAGDMKGAIL